MVAVIWIAFHPTKNIWPHLLATVSPRYLGNTVILLAGVAVLTAVAGTGTVWLVTMHRFTGRRWLDHALMFPPAIATCAGACAVVDLLQYAGPVQAGLRVTMGLTRA